MNDDVRLFRNTVRQFVRNEFVPHQGRWREQHGPDADAWANAGRAGILLPDLPEEYGGGGGTFAHEAAVLEELARSGVHFGCAIQSTVAHYIFAYGTEEQKRRWLPPMGRGEAVAAIASAERIGRSASTSTPMPELGENANSATSPQCETLKCRLSSATCGARAGFPFAPYASSTAAGAMPRRAPSSPRRRARATMNRRRWRWKKKRPARCRSDAERHACSARTSSGDTSSRATTTSKSSAARGIAMHAEARVLRVSDARRAR